MEHFGHPDLNAQLRVAHPNDGAPHLGRDSMDHTHAVFVIVQSLGELGLSSWSATLLQWLGRFDGFEMHLPDECDPAICVRQTLLRHVAAIPSPEEVAPPFSPERTGVLCRQIVQDLIELDFVSYRSYWGQLLAPRLHWDPLSHSWLTFLECGQPEEDICTWCPVHTNDQLLHSHSAFLLQGRGGGNLRGQC